MAPDDSTFFDAVVVGGGHNGLVAAAYLARAGLRVRLLERLDVVGGAAVSANAFDGVDARLSRYAYLVSLLPARILEDLGATVPLARRRYSSYTPDPADGGGQQGDGHQRPPRLPFPQAQPSQDQAGPASDNRGEKAGNMRGHQALQVRTGSHDNITTAGSVHGRGGQSPAMAAEPVNRRRQKPKSGSGRGRSSARHTR